MPHLSIIAQTIFVRNYSIGAIILNAKTTVAKRNELHMFTVLPQRWIVERSWSWLDKCRRLWKNCERALNSSLQMVVLAFLKIVLKRY
ncbi:transposase (plasmid) [Lacticaseibacillus paracasei]|nr:transposase [Lacticaseibacillus paracasei]